MLSGTVLSVLPVLAHLIFTKLPAGGTVITPNLKNAGDRELKELA